MRVAVTGGTGFIGRRLVAGLSAAGHEVCVLSRRPAENLQMPQSIRHVQGDLSGQADLDTFVDNVDVLFHCAGEISNPARMETLHVAGTRRLIHAANGRIGRWVQLSSTGAYGTRRAGLVTEEDALAPVGPYEVTKASSDELVWKAMKDGAFSASILRPSIVFGSSMPNQSLFAMLRMIEKRLLFFIGRPGASANYVHVDNVVHALLACAFQPAADGGTFNLSDHCTIERFVQYMADALGVAPPTRRLPEWPVRQAASLLEGIPAWPLKASRVDALTSFVRFPIHRIESVLGYRHSISMADAVSDLVAGYKARKT